MNVKTANLEGRPHLVVPVVMGVEGVWDGSDGPLLYTANELRRSAQHWNGRPVVVFHPDMRTGGQANHPDVFNRQKVGHVFNARFDQATRSLKADAYLDPVRLAQVDSRVLAAVKSGRMMEVSTGLHTDKWQEPGTFNGMSYHSIACNHRPDHLAILPDEVGACSIQMGAGLCRNLFRGQEALVAPAIFS